MPLTTTGGYTFPTPGIPTIQSPTSGSPAGQDIPNESEREDIKKSSYGFWNGDWLGYLQYMASKGDEASLDKLISFLSSEASADKARQWTAEREDSQYQRLIKDIRKAGYNPFALLNSGGSPIASSSGSNSYSGSQYVTSANNKATQELKDETNQVKLVSIITSILSAVIVAGIMAL